MNESPAREDIERGWTAAALAGALAVAMPAFVPFAALAFLDLPALLAVCVTLLAASRRPAIETLR